MLCRKLLSLSLLGISPEVCEAEPEALKRARRRATVLVPRPLQARIGPVPLRPWSSFGSVAFGQTGYHSYHTMILQATSSPQLVRKRLTSSGELLA